MVGWCSNLASFCEILSVFRGFDDLFLGPVWIEPNLITVSKAPQAKQGHEMLHSFKSKDSSDKGLNCTLSCACDLYNIAKCHWLFVISDPRPQRVQDINWSVELRY